MAKGLSKFELTQRLKKITDLHLQGKDVEEIAKQVGVSASQVYYDLAKQKKRWQESIQYNTDLVMAETLAELDVLKKTYWMAWERSKSPMQTKSRKVSQKADKANGKSKKNEDDAEKQTAQSVEMREETREKEGNASFLKGIEWCLNFRVELMGLKKINIDLVGDVEVEIEA